MVACARSAEDGTPGSLTRDNPEQQADAHEAACATARRYAALTRMAQVGFWEWNPKLRVARADAALAHLLHMDSNARLTVRQWLALVHADDRRRVFEYARHFLDKHRHDVDCSMPRIALRVRTGNRWRWVKIAQAEVDPDGPWLSLALMDITADVRDRFARQCAEQVYRDVWHSIPGSAVVLNAKGRIVDANPAWHEAAALGGAPTHAFIGESYVAVTERAARDGDAAAAEALDGITRVLHGKDTRFTLDYECTPPAGEGRWFRMNVFALRRPARGAVIIHWDITAPRATEIAIQAERDHLVHMHRLNTMNELATSIAHELNQPLATIMASASTARRLMDGVAEGELRPVIEDIHDATLRAAQVMRAARSMVRRHAPARELVSLNDAVGAVTRLVASDLVIHQVTLSVSLDPDLPPIHGDRIQLQQVVLNLLLNAIDALADQPTRCRCAHIKTLRSAPGRVELVVSDTGHGIAPEIASRLFDPFTTTKRDGTGLGLAIVRAIVEAHGGRVVAQSSAEGGAAFRVSLPYEPA